MIQVQAILAQKRNAGGEQRVAAEWLQQKLGALTDDQVMSFLRDTEEGGMNKIHTSALERDFMYGRWQQFYSPTIKATVEQILQEMRVQYDRIGLY